MYTQRLPSNTGCLKNIDCSESVLVQEYITAAVSDKMCKVTTFQIVSFPASYRNIVKYASPVHLVGPARVSSTPCS